MSSSHLPLVSLDVSAVPAKPAGAGLYIWELARKLVEEHSDNLALISRADDSQRWSELGTGLTVKAAAPGSRPLRLMWEQMRLPALLKHMAVDVHHGPHYTLPYVTATKRVSTIHDMTFFDHPEWHERSKVAYFRSAIARTVRTADHLVAVSQDTANKLQRRFGELAVTVIPHGLDHSRFRANAQDNDEMLLRRHGIEGSFIAFVGTLEPRKNIPALIRAFNEIASEFPDLKLVIAGRPGWGTDAVDEAQGVSPFADRIVRPGYLPSAVIPALLRNAELVAYPSLEEGFGLPALEALASGAVLVTTSGSAMQEVVEDAAHLVEPGNDDQLVDALRNGLTDSARREFLKQRGPQVAAKYTWQRCAKAHWSVYNAVSSA